MSAIPSPVVLADGRQLAYEDVGAPAGPVVLYLHGTPGSRTEVGRAAYRRAFADAGLRVIAIDRPGFGDSDPPRRPGHGPLAHDVAALLDRLGIERVVVVGVSRGALPALAQAALDAPRVAAVGLFGPTGLPDDPALMKSLPVPAQGWLALVKARPRVARAMLRTGAWLDRQHPAGAVGRLMQALPSVADRAQLLQVGAEWVDALAAGTRRDPGFCVDDWHSWLLDPLGFEPATVTVPVIVWTGADDRTCPPASSATLARRLPGARRTVLPGVGHLHTPTLLVALMQATVEAGRF